MRLRLLLAASAMAIASHAWAGDIKPIVNVATDRANDLRGLTFAADGKIYASGHAGTEDQLLQTVVARFNPDGSPDEGFGADGFVQLDFAPGRQEQSLGVAELANSDVVVAVNAVDEDAGESIYLLRFGPDGTQRVAPEWGDAAGAVEVVFGWANDKNDAYPGVDSAPVDTSWDVLVDRSGGAERIVILGMGSAPDGTGRTDNDRYVVRLNAADGSPDSSFNGGKPFTYHSASTFGDNARRGLIEPDGSIVSAGYTNLGGELRNHVVIIRLTPDGTLDPDFGNFVYPESSATAVGLVAQPGVAVFNPFVGDGGFAECYGVARLSDGSYVTTGYGAATGNGIASSLGFQTTAAQDLVTFRVTGAGLDMAWGTKGALAVQSEGLGQPTNEERGRRLVALADDRTVQVGRFGGNAAAYVVMPDGQLDTRQEGDGILKLGHPKIDSQFFNAVLSPDGTRIAMTTNANAYGARLVVLEVKQN